MHTHGDMFNVAVIVSWSADKLMGDRWLKTEYSVHAQPLYDQFCADNKVASVTFLVLLIAFFGKFNFVNS
jgi:hypothetical protein